MTNHADQLGKIVSFFSNTQDAYHYIKGEGKRPEAWIKQDTTHKNTHQTHTTNTHQTHTHKHIHIPATHNTITPAYKEAKRLSFL
jgi:hypothetical protein